MNEEEDNILLIPNHDNQQNQNDDTDEVEQNEIKFENIIIKVKYLNALSILSKYEEEIIIPEPFIEFNMQLEKYKWDVYRKPNEIRQNFEDIIDQLDKKNLNPKSDIRGILTQISNWNNDQIQLNLDTIKNYYTTLFKDDIINKTLSLKEFFNISSASFNQYNTGVKPFEGWGYKKADPHCLRKAFSIICYCIEYFAFAQYNLRWVVLTDDHIYYMKNSDSKKGKNLYFFDRNTSVKIAENNEKQIIITNSSRSLILAFKTVFERNIWYYEIKKRIDSKKEILANNPYEAYTNMKSGNQVQWFADGEKYFADLAKKLMEANESIFITDWWMSPEIWLVRPVPIKSYESLPKFNKKEEPPYSRLMDILYQCAHRDRGVKIYIQLYGENKYVLANNSNHTKKTLEALDPNIKVLRHPFNRLTFLYSHHEKLVIIDQCIAYVGGIDLCWGRYDTNEHPIFEPKNNSIDPQYLFPGIDYWNQRIRDVTNVENYLKECSIRDNETRMPWHDVQCCIIGPAVIDIARHFIERWNFTTFGTNEGITDIKQSSSSIISEEKKEGGYIRGWIDQALNKDKEKINTSEPLIPNGEEENNEIIDEMDDTYENKSNEDEIITSLRGHHNDDNDDDEDKELAEKRKKLRESMIKFYQNKKVIDEDCFYAEEDNDNEMELGKLSGKTQKNLIEEENEINTDSNLITENNNQEIKKAPPFYTKLINYASKSKFFKKLMGREEEEKEKLENNILNDNTFLKNIRSNMYGKKSDVQVLRSSCHWSVGINKKENSILQAYIKLIQQAEHYIYIENQFFVSKPFDEEDKRKCKHKNDLSNLIKNTIAYEIRKRIIKAYEENKKFRVIVLIPLLPGFAGEPEKSGTIQLILRYTYQAICRNYKTSLIEKLEEKMGEKWKDYIGFYSLRGHGLVNGLPKTELIYIHSKLMIVDDKKVIIGSANINDRSMLGDRDSEFCVLIHEKEEENFIIDGQKTKATSFAHSFRTHLMAEHMGLDINNENEKNILNDPLSNDLWSMLINTAKNNTEIYRKIFYCYPDDNMKTFNEVKKMKIPEQLKNGELEEFKKLYDKEKDNIKGHIVEFPLHFLEREALGIPFFSKENCVPQKSYT